MTGVRNAGSAGPASDHETIVEERLAKLDLPAKVRLLTGSDFWSLHSDRTIGLQRMLVSDGPIGVRGTGWDERDSSAALPCPSALAATWDVERVHELAGVLAQEARRKGVHAVLAPTVNLHRSPLGGRHFECFSEDPVLTARIGTAYVRGLQDRGVAATVKHFVANDSETERMSVNVRVSERALRELYLAPFETIVRSGGVWLVMAAYNAVGGTRMTEHPMLRDVLADEWGFDGVVISDWLANWSTVASGRGGLDLTMPGPEGPWGDHLVSAVRAGDVPESSVDDKVRRLLRFAARVGALTRPGQDTADENTPNASAVTPDDPALRAQLRAATAESFVLARNDGDRLPLTDVQRVAVLGPHADDPRVQGGGSASVIPPHVVTPLAGLRHACEDGPEVLHAPGVEVQDRSESTPLELLSDPETGELGVRVEYLDSADSVAHSEHRAAAEITWMGSLGPEIPADVATVRIRTRQRLETAGTHRFAAFAAGPVELAVSSHTVLSNTEPEAPGDALEALLRPPERRADVELDAGTVDVQVRYPLGMHRQFGTLGLGWRGPGEGEDAALNRAVDLAAAADVPVVVVGTTPAIESEGFDRSTLALPGRQDELVRRVAAANSRTVVVVNAGAPVDMPWFYEVAAVLLAWFPGQECGDALADVLFGVREPGGRLPTTWPENTDDVPVLSTAPEDGQLNYAEGVYIGYRAWQRSDRTPLLPFGYGLGYTTWELRDLTAPQSVAVDEDVPVEVTVVNTGSRLGKHVVQVYLSREDSAVDQPVRWLAGFATVRSYPDDSTTVTVTVPARCLQHWDVQRGCWYTERGRWVVEAGANIADLALSTDVDVG